MADSRNGTQQDQTGSADIIDLTANIVSAYVQNNTIAAGELPELIAGVNSALQGQLAAAAEPEPEPQKPAVSIRKSVTPQEIVCLECGKRFKSIRRHLGVEHDMEPAEYRAKWNLPRDYPMVAPEYAQRRSDMAKTMGLGRKAGQPGPAKGGRARSAKAKTEAAAG